MFLIGQHILGITDLEEWYQLEAADANCNGSISAFDLTRIRRVILGLDPDFITCDSWKFYDNPDGPASPANCLPNDCDNLNSNLYGVKTGDVSCSANLTSGPADVTTEFTVGNNGATLDVSISNGPTDPIVAFEFELEVSEDIVAVKDPYGMPFDESSYTLTEEGIRFAYAAGMSIGEGEDAAVLNFIDPNEEGQAQLFTLVFDGKTESVTSILSNSVLAVCYTREGDEFSLGMTDGDQVFGRASQSLFSGDEVSSFDEPHIDISPNPSIAGGELVLKIESAPTARTLRIIDGMGRVLLQESMDSKENGTAKVALETAALVPGLYTVVLFDEDGHLLASEACVIR